MVTGQNNGAISAEPQMFGHPRGLTYLFTTEMAERFSYYGMRALLVLYLVNVLKWDTARAANLYGTYTMLVFLTPVIGGYLADRFDPSMPFLAYAPLLLVSAFLLAVVGKETLER